MKTLEDQMAFYAAYHQDARNKATHFIGVPVTAAMVFASVVLVYYFMLDFALGAAMLLMNAVLLWAGHTIAGLGALQGWIGFGILLIGGWILQLVGHVFEGRKPALADNLFQIFVAPIFLCAELFFALGYKPKLHAAVQARAREMRAAADASLTAA